MLANLPLVGRLFAEEEAMSFATMEDAQHVVERLSDELQKTAEAVRDLREAQARARERRLAELQEDVDRLRAQKERLEAALVAIDGELCEKESALRRERDDGAGATKAVPYGLVRRCDDASTTAIIGALEGDEVFQTLAAAATEASSARDREEDAKLSEGVEFAVERGVLDEDVEVEPVRRIDITGRSAESVADEIYDACLEQDRSTSSAAQLEESSSASSAPSAPSSSFASVDKDVVGRVVVLQGPGGCGKGTTVAKLLQRFDAAVSWSNGNVFRSLALLASERARRSDKPLAKVLTEDNVKAWIGSPTLDLFPQGYDIAVDGEGITARVSKIANTLLKDPRVTAAVPAVAAYAQGEVLLYADRCVQRMRHDGLSVIVEGRAPALKYVRTPLRFELNVQDFSLLGKRRLANRILRLTMDKARSRDTHDKDDDDVFPLLKASLTEINK
mmetsp:Transcript_37741/g.121111  ORF Transcript_37741/g.121111 Transcript_37741/m.121111 type:complete len:448 (+) Transcript_37741:611-1954(+)